MCGAAICECLMQPQVIVGLFLGMLFATVIVGAVHFHEEGPAEGPAPHHRKLLLQAVISTITNIAPPPVEVETTTKKAELTGEEMQIVLADGLKNEGLNTANLADILGAYFNMDLSHRKAEVESLNYRYDKQDDG
ncbi:hypothetical protein LIER_00191 [Lithospermum erythrorhizon]|uniref:Uncharacterized protein n=1 Tax=Lithospermum erythrorhizon TaxID=34254 RepID=A0AAV3NHL0_LITER